MFGRDVQRCGSESCGVSMVCLFFFKQKGAYEVKEGDWSSDVCPSDLERHPQSTEPPLTFNTSPVMCRASGEHRNTIGPATSSALATRPSGIVRSIAARPSPAYGFADISVSTHPGATQFTVSFGASSTASDFVSAMTAPLVAA